MKAKKTTVARRRKRVTRITKEVARPNQIRNAAFWRVVRSIPKGCVATYGQVAAAAGYPRYHRMVAQFLHTSPPHALPWWRVIGAGGQIKLHFEAGAEQRLLLQMEGVTFRHGKVNLAAHQHRFGG